MIIWSILRLSSEKTNQKSPFILMLSQNLIFLQVSINCSFSRDQIFICDFKEPGRVKVSTIVVSVVNCSLQFPIQSTPKYKIYLERSIFVLKIFRLKNSK
jgi:hypothetical protein